MIERVGNVKLNLQHYSGEDFYSDGEVEQELLKIVSRYSSDDYNRIIAEKRSWPILYHLSEIRSNIIESVPISKEDRVLEIGSGCGAITGKLAEKAKSVTCIELSKRRSLINANRNRSHDNIEILLGNFVDIEKELEGEFDIITFIGVFEYAQLYTDKDDAYYEFLKMIMKHLSKGGKLIVAIENRIGLKYWGGCVEDHFSQYFVGLEGYPLVDGIKTFTKLEWEALLQRAGYEQYTFYYPYPDYKFPLVIYSDDYLPKKGELIDNEKNLDRDRLCLFNEGRVFDTMIDNRLFPEFSNSFLIIIEKEKMTNG